MKAALNAAMKKTLEKITYSYIENITTKFYEEKNIYENIFY